jgi:hypothetical protein
MIGVDKIGQIRRAYFEQHRSIKEIVRTLSVSRATVRKVIRGHKTEFKYERGVQPTPKLGDWVEVLTEILEQEAKLPKRERRSTQRLFEELRGRTVWDVFQEERASLMELRGPFDGFVEKAVRASTTCLIMADHNRYSVDARAAGRMVLVRSHAERIVVLLGDDLPFARVLKAPIHCIIP